MGLELVEQNVAALGQATRLLGDLDEPLYARSGEGWAGVGPHLRHCIDAYECFLRGAPAWERIDYDARARSLEVERERDAALEVLERIVARLREIPEASLERPVKVRMDAPEGAPDGGWTSSTVGRELCFLLSHTVHHFALVALALRSRGVDPGEEFGVAPSTLAHWRAEEPSCAP